MYVCTDCGAVKSCLPVFKQFLAYIGDEMYFEQAVDFSCACGGQFCEGEICRECGEYYHRDCREHNLCSHCAEKAVDKFRQCFSSRQQRCILYEYT